MKTADTLEVTKQEPLFSASEKEFAGKVLEECESHGEKGTADSPYGQRIQIGEGGALASAYTYLSYTQDRPVYVVHDGGPLVIEWNQSEMTITNTGDPLPENHVKELEMLGWKVNQPD